MSVCVYLSHRKLCWNKVTIQTGVHTNKLLLSDNQISLSYFQVLNNYGY